jgi:hypothetical protein
MGVQRPEEAKAAIPEPQPAGGPSYREAKGGDVAGRYRGSLPEPAEASILGTFRRALARFVTRFRGFI